MHSIVHMTASSESSEVWRDHLIETPEGVRRVITETHRIAVLGMKQEYDRPAFYVPEYAKQAGYEIVPVPVF